jgi:predicted O-methyltransferase YrrM
MTDLAAIQKKLKDKYRREGWPGVQKAIRRRIIKTIFPFGKDDWVKIDKAHSDLIYGLVVASKPSSIIEFGLGGGESTDSILRGVEFNQNSPTYSLVDNWLDFGGKVPAAVLKRYQGRVNLITAAEKDFVFSTTEKYDFILSDADHHHTQDWFDHVYDNLLVPNGVLIYHDIDFFESEFPNLRQIYFRAVERKLAFHLFNKNSRPEERCQRGLVVIFKPGDPVP